MNELDEIYLRSVSNETLGGDLAALNAVKWDRTEDQPDGTRVGFDDMTGQSFVLGKSEPPPAAPAPAAEAPPPAEEGSSLGEFLGRLDTALNAPFAGVAQGVARFLGNTAGAMGIVEQKEVDRFFKMVDDLSGAATKDNPTADVLGTVGSITGQYILPAVTGYNGLRALGAPKLLSSIVAEGMTGLLGLSPNDENIFNMLAEDSSSPAVAKVREMLATDPDDSEWANRSRNAADALLLLGASEALMRGLPKLVEQGKQFIKSDKGQQVVRSVEDMGARADERLGSVMRGETLSANPIGAAGDMALSAAGKVAGRMTTEADTYPNTINRMLYDAAEPPPAPEGARKWTKASLARAMQEQAEANGQTITQYDDAARETLATRIANEAASALQREGNASDWYNSKIVEMNNTLRQLHPELTDGSPAEGIFKTGLALTSNGSTVDYNLRAAEYVYSVFKDTGRYPTDLASLEKAVGGFGQEGPTLIKQLERANAHIDEMGTDGFVEFLNTKFTVRELNQMGYKVTGESMDFETYGSAIFGPKIGGGFYQNLRGNFDPVTFDRWWMASWGRWTGQPLLKTTDKARAKQLDRFRAASGKKYKNPAAAITAAKKIYDTYRKNNFQPRTELNQAAQRLAEGATDKMREQPAGPTERRFMRESTYAAVDKLREMGYDVTPADLQATVWYPEKELHGFYGIGSGRSAPDDYAAAAQRLLEERNAGQ